MLGLPRNAGPRLLFRAATSLLALVAFAPKVRGQGVSLPPYRSRVLGVYDDATGAPVDSVRVTDVLNGNSSLTTATGTVALYFLPDGGSLVRVQKIGYVVQTFTIAISAADTAPITITMRRVTELGPMVTKARETPQYIAPGLRGFEERRLSPAHTGYFVSDSVLRANEGHLLADVLVSRMPGIQFGSGEASAKFLLRSPRCTNGGPPAVYVDGVATTPDLRPDAPGYGNYFSPPKTIFGQPMPGAGGSKNIDAVAIDLTRFDVSSVQGVEWYPDSEMLPIEFSHSGNRCGALLIWTRER